MTHAQPAFRLALLASLEDLEAFLRARDLPPEAAFEVPARDGRAALRLFHGGGPGPEAGTEGRGAWAVYRPQGPGGPFHLVATLHPARLTPAALGFRLQDLAQGRGGATDAAPGPPEPAWVRAYPIWCRICSRRGLVAAPPFVAAGVLDALQSLAWFLVPHPTAGTVAVCSATCCAAALRGAHALPIPGPGPGEVPPERCQTGPEGGS